MVYFYLGKEYRLVLQYLSYRTNMITVTPRFHRSQENASERTHGMVRPIKDKNWSQI